MRFICPAGHVTTWPPIKRKCGAMHTNEMGRTYMCGRDCVVMSDEVSTAYRLGGVEAALDLLHAMTGGRAFDP